MRRPLPLVASLLIVCAAAAVPARAQVYDERGFKDTRDYFSQLPFEHIDPLTGNLLLTFTDLVLPGNAGFDLKVQRTYNSKIYRDTTFSTLDEDSWAGVGWTLHFGRVWHGTSATADPPVVEMPDGSRHRMFHHDVAPPPGCSGCWISREYWTYDKGSRVLKLPNGMVYTFGRVTTINSTPIAYATEIRDPYGNTITIEYDAAEADVITQVVQNLGTQTRTVTFAKETTYRSLRTMTYSGAQTHTWTYTQQGTDAVGFSVLTSVQPPITTGNGWSFEYYPVSPPAPNRKWELKKVTTPYGGEITYTFDQFESRLGTATPIPFRGVKTRVIGGRDIPGGNWTYGYAETTARNRTTITSPCGTTQLTFLGVGSQSPQAPWQVGLLSTKTISDGFGTQTETFTWQPSAKISNDDEIIISGGGSSLEIYVPLVQSRSVLRDGRTYVTTNTYATTNFNDFGRPYRIAENGPDYSPSEDRVTTRTFDYAFTPYIKDRIASETVTVGTESFVKSYSYVDATGFKDSETIHGLTVDFAPSLDGRGNVRSMTDESNHTTSYTYSWGVLDDTTTPVGFTIARTIDPEGTIDSETRRGFTTSFNYDGRFRLTFVNRPVGNDITYSYDDSGVAEFAQRDQGTSWTKTYLDGFGRPSATENGQGVKTDQRYDACGRRTYESYPFSGSFGDPGVNKGTTFGFDALGRMRSRMHPDNASVTYAYSNGTGGILLRVTNERLKVTDQIWKSFGDPDEARLATVVDANAKTWTYEYNAVGGLTRVTPPTGPDRQWTYYGPSEANGAHGLLKTERFPENENRLVTYTYYADGVLKTRDDPQFGITTFTADANHRPDFVDRPGTAYDTDIVHDASDNRTDLNNGYVSSHFVYDGSNRLTSRQDTVAGITHTTGYTPDGNDNVERIDYPSGLSVTYAYDTENRVTSARRTGFACPDSQGRCFAHSFQYHPSGAPSSYLSGNNVLHTLGYDANRYWLRSLDAGSILNLDYTNYDPAGNAIDIIDARPGFNQHFGYDNLDRMEVANGVWGTGGFSYDERGNRRSKSVAGQTTNFSYGTFDRLDSASGTEPDSFGYDFAGNLRTQNGRTYTYTPDSMMETATVGGVTTTYRYDGDNQRKQRSTAGAPSRYYVHGPGGQLLVEYEDGCQGGRTPVREYVYAGTRLLAAVKHGQQRTVSLTAAAASVSEAAATYTFSVRVVTSDGQPTTCPVTVNAATADGTAQAGSDYDALNVIISIPAGTGSGTPVSRDVTLRPDNLDEDDETFTITLSAPTQAELASPTVQTVTILDDDLPPTVSISDCSVPEGTGGTTPCPFAVTLSGPSGKQVSVTAGTSNGTALAGLDYEARTGVLLPFPPGTTSVPFPVNVIGDSLDEPNEFFSANLSAPVNATPGDMSGQGTILDDDAPPEMSVADVKTNDRNAGTTAYSAVSLSTQSGFTITVNYATTPNTAGPNVDYLPVTGMLTFLPGELRKTVPVRIVQDTLEEGGESYYVDLNSPVNVTVVDGRGETTILERNAVPPACASRLDPLDDGTGLPVDLLLSEIAPGQFIEVYNPGNSPMALGGVQHRLVSEPQFAALSTLAPTVVVPARGYSTLPWPSGFTDAGAGGEIVLFKNADFNNALNIVDFVCWGTNPHGSRKLQAESVGKWSGPCAPALANGAIHRKKDTTGTTAASYDVTLGPSPLNCVGIFTVTQASDINDGTCDSDCSLREAVIAANAAPGEDTIRLPKGGYLLREGGAGEDNAVVGDLDVVENLRLTGSGAISTVINCDGRLGDRIFDVRPGATLWLSGARLEGGNAASAVEDGGALRSLGTAVLKDVALNQNTAVRGGAVAVEGGAVTLDRVTASGNAASTDGGAVSVDCFSCSSILRNSTLSGNSAGGGGGGVHVAGGGSASLRGGTLSANVAGQGGGMSVSTGSIDFANSIIAGNSSLTGTGPDCSGTGLISQSYNLIGNSSGCPYFPGTGDQENLPALLGPLANNRGPTQTHALLSGSPAIDTGNPGSGGGIACEPRDQRSYLRPIDGDTVPGAVCDKGSFELCSPVFGDTGGNPAEPFIKDLTCRGIASGCGSGNFCPGQAVTRAQIAVFLVASLDENPSGANHDAYFADVANNGFAGYINRLYELGITGGCGGGNYCPGAELTREQMAVLLILAMEEKPSDAPDYFNDIQFSPARRYINRLWELGITAGCGGGAFCPIDPMRRDTTAVWLYVAFFTF